MRRQLAGRRPACTTARTASAPTRNDAKRTVAPARCEGRGCTRTQASVITPRIPSDPSSIRSGEGPAPEPGRRRDAHVPVGVIARTASTRSSTCVGPTAKCPPARVAIHPPSVESSKDCG
jgi:hypothetical protein